MSVGFALSSGDQGIGLPMVDKIAARKAGQAFAETWRQGMADRIKKARLARGWTQVDLSSESGVSVASIQSYEGAQREPSMAVAHMLAKALGMRVEELIFG